MCKYIICFPRCRRCTYNTTCSDDFCGDWRILLKGCWFSHFFWGRCIASDLSFFLSPLVTLLAAMTSRDMSFTYKTGKTQPNTWLEDKTRQDLDHICHICEWGALAPFRKEIPPLQLLWQIEKRHWNPFPWRSSGNPISNFRGRKWSHCCVVCFFLLGGLGWLCMVVIYVSIYIYIYLIQ